MAQLADIVNIFCQTMVPRKKHKFIFIPCDVFIIYFTGWEEGEVGGGRACWRGWVMGPLYLCFIVFADDHLARKFVYFTVCLLLVG